jgi:hypothetical protein
LQQHVQLVLTDRTDLSQGREFGVISEQTWRLADLGAKHAFLRGGLGWGHMPMPMVEVDLARGTLVEIVLQDAPRHRRIADVRGLPRRRTAAPGRTVADRPPPDRPGGGSAP